MLRKIIGLALVVVLAVAFVNVLKSNGIWPSDEPQFDVEITAGARVQSARVNKLETPHFEFIGHENWVDVTNELVSVDGASDRSNEYLYRYIDSGLVEHELWVVVNMADDYPYGRHTVPTRVLPVQLNQDGSLQRLNGISDSCIEILDENDPFLEPHTVVHQDVEYFCNPNVNAFTAILGVPGQDTRIAVPSNFSNAGDTITIVYRDMGAKPNGHELYRILEDFRIK